jgi:hypothetical protein
LAVDEIILEDKSVAGGLAGAAPIEIVTTLLLKAFLAL